MIEQVTITVNNKGKVLEALQESVERALEMIGTQAQNYAVLELEKPKAHGDGTVRPNVDTGRLVNSITHEVDYDTAVIGTDVEYAPYVELGTSISMAYPYLEPAVKNHVPEYKQIVEDCLKS